MIPNIHNGIVAGNFPVVKSNCMKHLLMLRREVKEKTSLIINSERLLGVSTHHWNTPKGIQHTFILLYHCINLSGEIRLNEKENDAYMWEKPEAIVLRSDLLDGNVKMFQELF